jgi:hypothetical protein
MLTQDLFTQENFSSAMTKASSTIKVEKENSQQLTQRTRSLIEHEQQRETKRQVAGSCLARAGETKICG